MTIIALQGQVEMSLQHRCKQRIINRRISNARELLKEMFNVLSYQGTANQNNSDILPYACHNVKDHYA